MSFTNLKDKHVHDVKCRSIESSNLTLLTGSTVTDISADTSLNPNSDEVLSTQKAIKAYVDNKFGIVPSQFTGLTDTPASYTGESDKIPVVNSSETGLEFTSEYVKPSTLVEAQRPHGFDTNALETITRNYDNTTQTFTISNATYPYVVYIQGIRFEVTGPMSTAHPDIEGVWIFGFQNIANVLTLTPFYFATITSNYQYLQYVAVGQLYWSSTATGGNGDAIPVSIDIPVSSNFAIGLILNRKVPATIKGAEYCVLTDFQADGTGADIADLQFRCNVGDLVYGLALETPINERLKTSEVMIAWYQWVGATVNQNLVRFIRNSNGKAVHHAVGGRAYYNQLVGGQFQLTEVTSGNYVIYHVFAHGRLEARTYEGYLVIMGQNQYSTLTAARDAIEDELGNLSIDETSARLFARVGSYIIESRDVYTNEAKSRIVTIDGTNPYLDTREFVLHSNGGGGTAGGVTDHGTLSGLGDDDHLQYALLDVNRTAAGAGNVEMSSDYIIVNTTLYTDNIEQNTGSTITIPTQQVTVGNSTTLTESLLHVQGREEVRFWLEGDTDSTSGADNPTIIMSQDGGGTITRFGIDNNNNAYIANTSVGGTVQQDFSIYYTGSHTNNGTGNLPTGWSGVTRSLYISGLTGNIQVDNGLRFPTGALITLFSTDGTLAGNSDATIPTEKAIKTYVDGQIGGATNHSALSNLTNDDHPQYAILNSNRTGSGNTDLKIGYSASSADSLIHCQSSQNALMWIESDTDNTPETDNPSIILTQDGGTVSARFGVNSANATYISNTSVGGTTTQDIEFYYNGSHTYNGAGILPSGFVLGDKALAISGTSGNTTIHKELQFLTGTGINEFSIDGTLAGNSDNAVPTEKAVKTYVDGKTTTSTLAVNVQGPWGTTYPVTISMRKSGGIIVIRIPGVVQTHSSSDIIDFSADLPADYRPTTNTVYAPICAVNDGAAIHGWLTITTAGVMEIKNESELPSREFTAGQCGYYTCRVTYE